MTNIDRRYMMIGVVLAILGIAGCGLAFSTGTKMEAFGQSYLYAWVLAASMVLGCFALTILFHITRGRWATPLLRLFEAGGGPVALLLLTVAFVPIAFVFRDNLYQSWIVNPTHDIAILRKSTYLNVPMWTGLNFGILLSFTALAYFFQSWTRMEEKTGDTKWGRKRDNFASISMVYFLVAMTFLMVNVVMSLDAKWYSTIFPITFVVASGLFALSFAVITVITSSKQDPYKEIVKDKLMLSDFGNLLLMFVMVWTYFTFSQLLIIWSGNLPTLTAYYRARMVGNYGTLGFFELAFNFALPFVCLLVIPFKRNTTSLLLIAAFIFLTRVTDLHYLVMPFLRPDLMLNAADVGCTALILGLWFIQYSRVLRAAPLITKAWPSGDPALEASHA